ncbi:MAG TPA: MBL fold metallo-hydrolase [Gemmatimonadales bacterium]|nr:MBL fold metallo-hydrolase [Gemmatimonadales bacterium]
MLARPITVGGLRGHLLEAGTQRLDGGAMFGVVPKPLWERRIPADERNRIPLAMRCLLLEHPEGLLLIDTGLGNKEDARFRDIYGVENSGQSGPTQLEDALLEAGHRPEDVRWVLNSHLHFDHAGGNTRINDGGEVELSFPHATYLVQRRELEFARHTNERTRASYLPPNFDPVDAAGRWQLLEGEQQVLPGVRVVPTPGHVPWHHSIILSDRGETVVFLGDLIPTSAHLPLPWIMGYDLEPLRTLESKRALLGRAEAEGWRLVFEHDPVVAAGRLVREGKNFALADVDRLDSAV